MFNSFVSEIIMQRMPSLKTKNTRKELGSLSVCRFHAKRNLNITQEKPHYIYQ